VKQVLHPVTSVSNETVTSISLFAVYLASL